MTPGGVRIGAPAMTSRGLKEADFEKIGDFLPPRHAARPRGAGEVRQEARRLRQGARGRVRAEDQGAARRGRGVGGQVLHARPLNGRPLAFVWRVRRREVRGEYGVMNPLRGARVGRESCAGRRRLANDLQVDAQPVAAAAAAAARWRRESRARETLVRPPAGRPRPPRPPTPVRSLRARRGPRAASPRAQPRSWRRRPPPSREDARKASTSPPPPPLADAVRLGPTAMDETRRRCRRRRRRRRGGARAPRPCAFATATLSRGPPGGRRAHRRRRPRPRGASRGPGRAPTRAVRGAEEPLLSMVPNMKRSLGANRRRVRRGEGGRSSTTSKLRRAISS